MEFKSAKAKLFSQVNLSLTDDIIEELKELFNSNKSRNGQLRLDKYIKILEDFDLSVSEEEYREYSNRIFMDDNAYIQFPEFTHRIARKMLETAVQDEIKQLYKMFDSKNIGYITAADVKNVLWTLNPRITDEDVQTIVKDGDLDEDGVLSYEQFVHICLPK